MKKLFPFLFALTMGLGTANAETLRVATTPNSTPFGFLNAQSNTIEGLMPDVITAIGKELGVTVDIQAMPFGSLIPALTSKRVDLVAAGMFATDERRKVVNFSDTVYTFGEGLVVQKKDTTPYTSYEDLKGQIVGAQIGTVYLIKLKDSGLFSEVKAYESLPELMSDINTGRVKAGFGDYPIVSYHLQQGNFSNLHLVKTYRPFLEGSIAFAIHKDQLELLERINTALATIKANGQLDQIIQKWGL